MTANEWLKIPEQDLPVKLAEVLAKKPWMCGAAMVDEGCCTCPKCGETYWKNGKFVGSADPCPVPDPIKIEGPEAWNTAMEAYRDVGPQRADTYLHQVWEMLIESPAYVKYMGYEMWKDEESQPKHYLIAAAMAVEGKQE